MFVFWVLKIYFIRFTYRKLGYKRKGGKSVDRRAKKSADDYQKSNLKIFLFLLKFFFHVFCSLEFTGDGQAHFGLRFARYCNLTAYLTRRNLCDAIIYIFEK